MIMNGPGPCSLDKKSMQDVKVSSQATNAGQASAGKEHRIALQRAAR